MSEFLAKNPCKDCPDYDHDASGRLVYWDYVRRGYQLLEPGMPITDPHLAIGKIGQQNILPTHFTLKVKDLGDTVITSEGGRAVGMPVPSGISAFLFFGSKESSQHKLDSLSASCVGRPPDRKNRAYIAQVGDIDKAGWTTFYAPLIDRNCPIYNPLHVIIVPDSILITRKSTDANEREKVLIAQTFVRWEYALDA